MPSCMPYNTTCAPWETYARRLHTLSSVVPFFLGWAGEKDVNVPEERGNCRFTSSNSLASLYGCSSWDLLFSLSASTPTASVPPICHAARAGPVRNLGRYSSVSIYRCLNSQHRQRQPRDEREVQIIAILLRFMYPYDYLHCIVHCFPFLVGLGMGLKNGSAWEKFASHSRSVEHSLDGREGERQFRRDP